MQLPVARGIRYIVHTSGHMYIYVLEAMRPFVLVIHFSSTYTGHSMYYMHVVAVSSDCIRGPRRYACSIAIHHCPTKVLHMPFVFTPAAYPHCSKKYLNEILFLGMCVKYRLIY